MYVNFTLTGEECATFYSTYCKIQVVQTSRNLKDPGTFTVVIKNYQISVFVSI